MPGRKSIYETKIKPHLGEIKKWLKTGATEKQIYETLGVSKTAFYKYKKENAEFAELLKNGRTELVTELRGALVKKALGGYTYSTKKTTMKTDGNQKSVTIETSEHYAEPDVAALNLCLKNYDSENWANDPQMLELKKQELKLKEEQAKKDDW